MNNSFTPQPQQAQPKALVLFTYVFNEDIARVYECYTNAHLMIEVTLNGFIDNFIIKEMYTMDQEGLTYSYRWKKQYTITMKTSNQIHNHSYRSFTHTAINVKELENCPQFEFKYHFHWNSCEQTTFFLFEASCEDAQILCEIEQQFTPEEKISICKRIDVFLRNSIKNLYQYESIIINKPLTDIWKYISENNFVFACGLYPGECCSQVQGSLTSIGSIIYIYEKERFDHVLDVMVIKRIVMSEQRIKYVFQSKKISQEPLQTYKLMIECLPGGSCVLIIKNRFMEYATAQYLAELGKRKRNMLKRIRARFEDK
jgi:hypothetical protein